MLFVFPFKIRKGILATNKEFTEATEPTPVILTVIPTTAKGGQGTVPAEAQTQTGY